MYALRLAAVLLISGVTWSLLAASLLLATPRCARAEDELDDVLGGFEETGEASAAEADAEAVVDDALSGFENDGGEREGASPDSSDDERLWDLSGGLRLGASYNVRPHFSSTGTYYGNLQRLNLKADLQLDIALPADWKFRAQAYGFYDFAYLAHGRDDYTREVLDTYEWDVDFQDVYFEGSLGRSIDLKLGRQVINWGRSDNLRVTDVINPLDNREPGLTDIEDLRRPVSAARVDFYHGPWNLTTFVIPEIRYDYIPAFGSDFFPVIDPAHDIPLPPGVPAVVLAPLLANVGPNELGDLPDASASQWGSTPEYGAALNGVFSGWDFSLYAARIVQNQSTILMNFSSAILARLDDDRTTMLGAGANYTVGSWLFKAELAYLNGVAYTILEADLSAPFLFRAPRLERDRLDVMGGVEYYGLHDTTIAVEVANRHIFAYQAKLRQLPSYTVEDSVEMAVRVTSDLMNARLHLTGLGLIFGERAQRGAILRFSADYDLRDALVLGGGLLYFIEGDLPPLDSWNHNDRLFLSLKYSF